jgi:hypothetical protein
MSNEVHDVEPAAISASRRAKTASGGKIATANRLRDGVVIYLNAQGLWVTEVTEARVATTPEQEAELKAALDAGVKNSLLIDTQIIDLSADASKPARLREQIRAVGPTVRPDLARRPNW